MIRFKHHKTGDGRWDRHETSAKDAETALLYWYGSNVPPQRLPADLPPLTVFVGKPLTYPTEGQPLVDNCVAACERTFNRAPTLTGDTAAQSRQLLRWLAEHGDVYDLTHDGEL